MLEKGNRIIAQDVVDAVNASSGGLEIGDIGIAALPIDESKQKRRYLNGQSISQEQFAAFTAKLRAAVALYPSLACTESEWQNIVSSSKLGQCGKFVIDDGNGTIRLPKIIKLQGTLSLANIGNIVNDGLPTLTTNSTGNHTHTRGSMNITGKMVPQYNIISSYEGAFYSTSQNVESNRGWESSKSSTAINFDASRSWTGSTSSNGAHSHTITGTSNTVQEEAMQYPYFIQVASSGPEAEIPNEILYTKLNTDVSNITSVGKSLISGLSMPSDSYVDLVLGASGTQYTAPANGYIAISKISTAAGQYIDLFGGEFNITCVAHANDQGIKLYAPVRKGKNFGVTYTVAGTLEFFKFVYAEGEE